MSFSGVFGTDFDFTIDMIFYQKPEILRKKKRVYDALCSKVLFFELFSYMCFDLYEIIKLLKGLFFSFLYLYRIIINLP